MKLIIGAGENVAYKVICEALNISLLAPIGRGNGLRSILLSGAETEKETDCLDLRKSYIFAHFSQNDFYERPQPIPTIFIDDATGSAVIIRPDWLTGCPTCFSAKIQAASKFYGELTDPTLSDNVVLSIIVLFDHFHFLPIAASRCHPDQNWSVFLPLADCSHCAHLHRSRKVFINLYSALWKACAIEQRVEEIPANNNSTTRSVSSEAFVRCNRGFIGFAAIVGNFTLVEEEPLALLTHGPIFLHDDPKFNEIAGGKGFEINQSLASCLGEGLERYFLGRPFGDSGIVATKRELGDLACDPIKEFGFPVNDSHPTLCRYSDDLAIEWVKATELTEDKSILIPANLVYCPYNPVDGAHSISSSSTNSAAAGANLTDATIQGLFETIERDAFWFYARTRMTVLKIPEKMLPLTMQDYIHSHLWAKFEAMVLPSPFSQVSVVQVVMASRRDNDTRTARGTGATPNLLSSIERAFSECLQMYYSLSDTLDDDPDPLNMRAIWINGSAENLFPNFFEPVNAKLATHQNPTDSHNILKSIISDAIKQELKIYRYEICNSPSFSVVKTFMSRMAIMDALYFENNERFSQYGRFMGVSSPNIHYAGPLFM